ncbi:MAG: hypothetical protein QF805_14690 [Pirellulaceae bacterium]|nr:hypothetical protein [Pirellulaceae bacterium]
MTHLLTTARFAIRALHISPALLLSAASLTATATNADQPTSRQLLKSPPVIRSGEADPRSISRLTDGDSATHATLVAKDGHVELLFDLGETRTATSFRVELPRTDAMLRVQVYGSTISAQAGFALLRAEMVDHRGGERELEFPDTSARWLLIRLTPPDKTTKFQVGELIVSGYSGPPRSHYAFNTSPAKALDVLTKFNLSDSLDVQLAPAEVALFADARDGKLDDISFAEASLLASGVLNDARRRRYLDQLDKLTVKAKEVVAAEQEPFAKAQALLEWLHSSAGPLHKGYVAEQTDVATVLDTGTFNCVSSAATFNLFAARLGLDARAIEVPDHAFSIVYDGARHADVETTNRHGFNPARDAKGRERFERETGFRYIPDAHRDRRREIGDCGLVALTYYNHGVTLTRQKEYKAALLAYFRAMSMDAEFHSAVTNALAGLVNWGNELQEQDHFEQADRVISLGLQLAPVDASLLHNRNVVFTRWAESKMNEGDDDGALEILRRAAKLAPQSHFVSMQAWIYMRVGESHVENSDWERAIATADKGIGKLGSEPKQELAEWKSNVYLRWGCQLVDSKKFDEAVAVYTVARDDGSSRKRIAGALAYAVQEWLRHAIATDDSDAARQVLRRQLASFPDEQPLRDVAKNHVRRVFLTLRNDGKFADALTAVDDHAEFVDDRERTDLRRDGYSSWARRLIEQKQWSEAVDIQARGLNQLPGDSRLTQNLVYTIQQWARSLHQEKDAAAARDMLLAQTARFADVKGVARVAGNFAQNLVVGRIQAKEYDSALKALDENTKLLDPSRTLQLTRGVYDSSASDHRQQKQWRLADDVYRRGLERLPNDSHLKRNAVALWHAPPRCSPSSGCRPASLRCASRPSPPCCRC